MLIKAVKQRDEGNASIQKVNTFTCGKRNYAKVCDEFPTEYEVDNNIYVPIIHYIMMHYAIKDGLKISGKKGK